MIEAVLIKAGNVPSYQTVYKKTGEKPYSLVKSIRMFDKDGKNKEIKADENCLFLVSAGDVTVIGVETIVKWKPTAEALYEFLAEDIGYDQ